MNKRGQFFIMAAIIVVVVISGLTGVATYINIGNEQRTFYDLSKEVGFETKKVLDWGVFNDKEIDGLTESFLFKYSDYIGQDEVIFIYGNGEGYKALRFEEDRIGSIGLDTGMVKEININRRTEKKAKVILSENDVSVIINEISYDFNLREGQNFFFVIIKEVQNERFVATG